MNPHSEIPSIDASSFSLDTYRWQNRLLLLFATSEQTHAYKTQVQMLEEHADGFRDRDLLLVPILSSHRSSTGGSSSADTAAANRLRESAAEKLRQRFNTRSDDFVAILIGKDGTEKRRERQPIEPSDLFNQIDSMPMRQQEMQQQKPL
ncbi:DUF4174 domain-containing protein [Oculatella sp. LEGE 06141]|uniref:DUF4174 domain-containing protein n=1 Tax=Oculatella sp. LEGE 06141 TaxID=1828648 RepID=UPI0018819B10|nr:DUF4174 domain-containing protein [Oculatella sp. LEGE 06141]MBE9182012.1 DUF4174 domain-containing protein [Oculatella sp. LEGE 06141]